MLTPDEKIEITAKLGKQNCYPVFLSQAQLNGFYNDYSNRILWPFFHGLPVNLTASQQQKSWQIYKQVNTIYADIITNICQADDNHIWIHDYHLFLLPELLRHTRQTDKIGFFMHIPFPPPDKFTALKNARQLTRGVLGSDLIGFHTQSYVSNFTRSCLELEVARPSKSGLVVKNRAIKLSNFPIGINYDEITKIGHSSITKQKLSQLQTKYHGQKVVLIVDRLDPTKGLVQRVAAYRDLLSKQPQLHSKIIMIIIAAPSRADIKEYQSNRSDLEKLVGQTNNQFHTNKWRPIEYHYESLPLEDLIPLYQLADIALIVPLADGMNLVAKEYVASKLDDSGVLVLSKTAGAAEELNRAILVDPASRSSLVDGLKQAISMSKPEITSRMRDMKKSVMGHTIQGWVDDFISALDNNSDWQDKMLAAYTSASRRVFLLDYDGTLVSFASKPELAKPTSRVKRILGQLASQKQNEVIIVSGRSREDLDKWFRNIPVTLIAEHGSFVRPASSKKWQSDSHDTTWKPIVRDILTEYVAKIPGSFIEQKNLALVWHYRTTDHAQAKKFLPSIKKSLLQMAGSFNLKIEDGNMILEIMPSNISKSSAATRSSKNADFVFAIGDDTTDEAMFRALPPPAWTIKVGAGITDARYRVDNVEAVLDLLEKFNS